MSTLKTGTVQNNSGTGAPLFKNNSGTEIGQLCKAWLNLTGTGTIAIADSFNISSVTDVGNGRYRATFTNSMSNANYVVVGTSEYIEGSGNQYQIISIVSSTTTTFELGNQTLNNIQVDGLVYLAVFGD